MIRLPSVLASSLLIFALAQPLGATPPPGDPLLVPQVDTLPILEVPRPVRVRMELTVESANDKWTSIVTDDTDEVYYFLVRPQVDDTLQIREVRRAGTPDVWEMGEETETTLHRWLAAGRASTQSPLRFALVVAEQDSSIAPQGPLDTGPTPYDGDLKQGIAEVQARIHARHHDEMAVLQVTATADRITVTTKKGEVMKNTDTFASLRFQAHNTWYKVRLFLEPDAGPAPTGRRFIGQEDDDCQPGKSLLVTTTAGEVPVPPGGTKTVTIPKKRFTWHCGGSEESSVARPNTQEIDVVRVDNSDKVRWKCFRRVALTPDFRQ